MNAQDKVVKEMTDGRGRVHTTDEQGRVLVYDRITDNLTSTGVWVDKDGKTSKY